MSVYEEIFGKGGQEDHGMSLILAVCALADEVRALRVAYVDRNQQIDDDNEKLDQEHEEQAEEKRKQFERLLEQQQAIVGHVGHLTGPPVPFAIPHRFIVPLNCMCGPHQHDEHGCLVCDCKEPGA